jgi:flagellar motor switch protein FliG
MEAAAGRSGLLPSRSSGANELQVYIRSVLTKTLGEDKAGGIIDRILLGDIAISAATMPISRKKSSTGC